MLRTAWVRIGHEVDIEVGELIGEIIFDGVGHGAKDQRELRAVEDYEVELGVDLYFRSIETHLPT